MEQFVLDNPNVFLFISAGIALILFAYLLYYWRRFRAITKNYESLHLETPPASGEIRIKIWVSDDKARSRWLRLLPATEIGFLVLKTDTVVLHAVNIDGERRRHQFMRDTWETEWIGNQRLNDSNLQWFALYEGTVRILVSAYTGINAASSRQQTAELYRNIVGQHAQFPGAKDFALEKNPASLSALIIMSLSFIYAFADGMFLNPLELISGLEENILLIIPVLFVGIAIIEFGCYKMMVRKKVPSRESVTLAMLLGAALLLAALPGAKRLDTALAKEPMQPHAYRMTEEGVFQSIDPGPPELDLKVDCDYWKQYAEDQQHLFPLQRGGLGFWQFDGRELDADIEKYLEENPDQLE